MKRILIAGISWKQIYAQGEKIITSTDGETVVVVKDYSIMPKRERKDNQNPRTNTLNYGGSEHINRNSIRIPSKKHKNRYKNFKRLFPNHE